MGRLLAWSLLGRLDWQWLVEGNSSANGRAARPAKMAHCNPPSLPIPAISNLILCKSTKTLAMTSTPLGSHGVFPKKCFCNMS